MTYEDFIARISALIAKAGGDIRARFFNDTERGLYRCSCSDGTVITGHPSGLRITIRYGSGHQMMATL